MKVLDLGRMDYGDCLQLMEKTHAEVAGGGENTVLVVEHPLVATLGRRGEENEVFDNTLPVYKIDRGGKATLHGPGQLVVYPIVHLGEGNRDVRAWVRHLESLLISMLGEFGIAAETRPEYPGVWTQKTGKKIASIGISIRSWTSYHGIAINVELAPREFDRIDPCGLGSAVMTNMQLEGANCTMADVKSWVLENCGDHFARFSPITTGR